MARGNVDFGVVVQRTDPYCLGVGSSTYGANPLSSPAQAEAERTLDARFVRLPVGYRNGRVTTSAGGTDGTLDIPALADLYRSWGYRIIAVCGGRTTDRDIVQGDAQRIAEALGFDMIDYSSPNEPDNAGNWTVEPVGRAGEWGGQYSVTDTAAMVLDDLRKVNRDAKIWGPVWVDERVGHSRRYMEIMGPERLAGIDFHRYGGGMGHGPAQKSTQTFFDETPTKFGTMIANCRADLSARGINAEYGNVNLDEINFRWIFEGDQRFFQAVNTVWMTSALGHVLSNGGKVMPYATQNGPLGVMVERQSWAPEHNPDNRPASSPMPAYWAIAAFTGNHVWSHYKDAFYNASTDDPGVEVFAVNNEAGGYNLIVVNKKENTDSTLSLDLANVRGGGVTVYQSSKQRPYDQPAVVRDGERYDGSLSLQLPACTITIAVLSPDDVRPSQPDEPAVAVEPRDTWSVDAGATSAEAGWVTDGGLVEGGNPGSNPGVTSSDGTGAVFDTERWGPQTWTIPVVPGDYDVTLLFSERFAGAQVPGGRLFDIDVNGTVVNGVDVWTEQGGEVGGVYRPVFRVTAADSVRVALSVGPNGDNPFINGILVAGVSAPQIDLTAAKAAFSRVVAAQEALAVAVAALGAEIEALDSSQV